MTENTAAQGESNRDSRPTIETANLVLRPFAGADAPVVQVLAHDKQIAANTRTIPYPYPEGAALEWIDQHATSWLEGKAAVFAIVLKETMELTGAIGLEISEIDQNAELGYWVGRDYWNRGIATEAAAAVVRFGLETLALHKIHAHHMTRNPASGRIMEKIGMTREGLLRSHIRKWGVFEDVAFFGILKSELSEIRVPGLVLPKT